MIDGILHDKVQELINQMGPFYQYPSEEKSVNEKNFPRNISTLASDNTVTMEDSEEMFQKILQENNPKSNTRKKNKSPSIDQVYDTNGPSITYCWPHGITSNLFHNRKYRTSQKEGHKLNATYKNNTGGCTEC